MQQTRPRTSRRHGLTMLALLAAPLVAAGQSPNAAQDSQAAFHRAYYLEHEGGDLRAAMTLYRGIADDQRAAPELRDKARVSARNLAEDLAASDFARLMPADAILYVELNRPGEQLGGLLTRLGLMQADGAAASGFGLSPALLSGALDMRGAAIAITAIDPHGGPPRGVAVLHAGRVDLLRGMIETAIPAAGTPVEAIGGHPTFSIEGQALVTLTSRLIVAGNDPGAMAGVVQRLGGAAQGSLAENPALHEALASRGQDLVYFCVNPAPVMPMLRGMLQQQAAHDPQTALALTLLDIDSLVGLAGRLALNEAGLALDVSLHLEEGHQNLVFNLLRMPSVQRRTLELVPEGAAFFLATALNEPMPAGAVVVKSAASSTSSTAESPAISMMDFGRELFGNLVDLAVYALPPTGPTQAGALPDVAAILRVNDVARSKALWSLVLGLGSQAASASRTAEPERIEIEGVAVEVFDMGRMPLFLATLKDGLVVSPSRNALQRSLRSMQGQRSILADAAFAHALSGVDEASTFTAMIHLGRCAVMAQSFAPPHEARELARFAPLLGEMVVALGFEHSDTHAALRARIENLPDVSGFVNHMMAQQKAGARSAQHRGAHMAPPPPRLADSVH